MRSKTRATARQSRSMREISPSPQKLTEIYTNRQFQTVFDLRICRKTYLKLRLINLSTTVFAFCINPKNTPLWLDSVATEKANQWPITVGTIYKNQNKLGKWSTYTVTVFIENEVFELASNDKN